MTREEERLKQIKAASINYGYQKCSDGINSLICAEDFLNGAEWADQHPMKGLWDSKKVCKWIEEHSGAYMILENDEEGELQAVYYYSQLLKDLRKIMED